MSQIAEEHLSQLLSDSGSGCELGLFWKLPDVPVTVLRVVVNGHIVDHDDMVQRSPRIFPLGPPDENGQYTVTWFVAPEDDVTAMLLVIRNRNGGARVTVDATGATSRGDVWKNTAGVTVNAP